MRAHSEHFHGTCDHRHLRNIIFSRLPDPACVQAGRSPCLSGTLEVGCLGQFLTCGVEHCRGALAVIHELRSLIVEVALGAAETSDGCLNPGDVSADKVIDNSVENPSLLGCPCGWTGQEVQRSVDAASLLS